MHCKRVLINDEVVAEEKGINLWDFSGKNNIYTLATLHKFVQEFYNPVTADFIASARDFMIHYNDHAKSEPSIARLLMFWSIQKPSCAQGLAAAAQVATQFTRSDDKLAALRDSQHLLASLAAPSKQRQHGHDRSQRGLKQGSGFIPHAVFSTLPRADDGRRLCLKCLSTDGCKVAKCFRAQFRPDTLSDEAKAHVAERWMTRGG
ncbi:hypothetical protein PHMEG_00039048 [Phytophthora megakarya]|uniref:Uncharacterized protein n=1 Tax=Phytophthora megakarya TaxID=4795 RepID=A0A225UGN5_9STRA|nr:hypothetical protein PHMEG_00039048 [Phytophthora megakarya]